MLDAVTYSDVQATPLLELPTAVMADAFLTVVRTQTITTRAAANHMFERGRGVLVTVLGPAAS